MSLELSAMLHNITDQLKTDISSHASNSGYLSQSQMNVDGLSNKSAVGSADPLFVPKRYSVGKTLSTPRQHAADQTLIGGQR